ncbi:MAG: SRPBCC family protein [Daejeonella sp.]
MPLIKLETCINAPASVCFDLSRDINMHINSMAGTKEVAIAGITKGLINLNETVTWKAKHLGIVMKMTIKITEMKFPLSFTDEMVTGPFKRLKHQHKFISKKDSTLMIDEFQFESPLGILGKVANRLFLKKYMVHLLKHRNTAIKQAAETLYIKAGL